MRAISEVLEIPLRLGRGEHPLLVVGPCLGVPAAGVHVLLIDAGVPLDLFHSPIPGTWIQRTANGLRALLVNWDDIPCGRSINLAPFGADSGKVVDFWTDEPLRLEQGRLTKTLPPHTCLLATINPRS